MTLFSNFYILSRSQTIMFFKKLEHTILLILFYFLNYLMLIIQGDFIVIIPYVGTVYFGQVHLSIIFSFSIPPPSFSLYQTVFG
jgi:hypothetical protein